MEDLNWPEFNTDFMLMYLNDHTMLKPNLPQGQGYKSRRKAKPGKRQRSVTVTRHNDSSLQDFYSEVIDDEVRSKHIRKLDYI